MMKASIQFDYKGRFRILITDANGDIHTGEWSGHTFLATIEVAGKTYIAGTEYGLLPEAETVYEIAQAHQTEIDCITGKDHSSEATED